MTQLEQWIINYLSQRKDFEGVCLRDMSMCVDIARMMREKCAIDLALSESGRVSEVDKQMFDHVGETEVKE